MLDCCLTFRFYSDFLFPFSVCEIGLLAFGLLSKISEFSDCEFSTTHNFGGLPQHRSLPQPAQHLQHAVLAETARPPVQWSSVFLFCWTAVVHFSGFMVQDHVSCVEFEVPCSRFSCPKIVLQFMLYGDCSKFSRLRLFALHFRLWLWSCCRLRPPLVASCQALEFVFELRLQYSWFPALC